MKHIGVIMAIVLAALSAGAASITTVTLAGAQTEANTSAIGEISEDQENLDQRTRGLEIDRATSIQQVGRIQRDINDLKDEQSTTNDLLRNLIGKVGRIAE